MSFTVQAESPPLREDSDGALRIGDSRVLLELVVRAFEDGATPETIAQRYSTLSLSNVYAVIGYYLRHREEINEYMKHREQQANEFEQRSVGQVELGEIRARIQKKR